MMSVSLKAALIPLQQLDRVRQVGNAVELRQDRIELIPRIAAATGWLFGEHGI